MNQPKQFKAAYGHRLQVMPLHHAADRAVNIQRFFDLGGRESLRFQLQRQFVFRVSALVVFLNEFIQREIDNLHAAGSFELFGVRFAGNQAGRLADCAKAHGGDFAFGTRNAQQHAEPFCDGYNRAVQNFSRLALLVEIAHNLHRRRKRVVSGRCEQDIRRFCGAVTRLKPHLGAARRDKENRQFLRCDLFQRAVFHVDSHRIAELL
ncbi:hypothetical protein SDC9_79944 [bioreactor metagenome]|uniref:Uncharacterized protein n=1 Tax=bioreactor metagenome TaxID=1076179 RepID=A0A644YXM1_9ZZZZ